MNRNRFVWTLLAVCYPGLFACGETTDEPVSAQKLALTAQENVERALRGAHEAGSFVAESAALAELFGTMSEECAAEAPPCAGAGCPAPEPTCEDTEEAADLREARDELRESIDELVDALREQVFTDANLESSDATSATYLLGPDFFCDSESSDVAPAPTPGAPEPGLPAPGEADPECVERAQKMQVRLKLSSPREGDVNVALLLSAQRRNPATLELARSRLGLVVDLGELKAAADALDEELEGVAAMAGKVSLELVRNAALDFSLRFNVLNALAITTVDDLDQQVSFSLGVSKPAIELRLDGNARQVIGKYDYAALGLSGPLNAFRDMFADDETLDANGNPLPMKTYTGQIDLAMAGYDGQVVLDGSRDRLDLTNVGLGDASSTLKWNGTTIAQLDVNAAAGRRFDASIEKAGDDHVTYGFSPTLDVSLLLNFAPLANQIEDIPDFALGDTIRFWLEGANPSLRAEDGQVRVVSGTMNMSSTRRPDANLSVPTGGCLLESNVEEPAHAVLGEFVSGTCR